MQKIKICFCFMLLFSIAACKNMHISPETKVLLLEDLFIKVNDNMVQQLNCEGILIYKYLAKLDSIIFVDTIRVDRPVLPKLDIQMGDKKISFIDDFLNKNRNKYKNIRPSCGIIISDVNVISDDKIYFIVNIFSNSMTSDIFRVNYLIKNNKPLFIDYKFLEGT